MDSKKMLTCWVLCLGIVLCVIEGSLGLYSMARLNLNDGKKPQCSRPCNTHTCSIVLPDDCSGRIIKDHCDCCPLCDTTVSAVTESTHNNNDSSLAIEDDDPEACKQIECARNQMCLLNIQGIPVCRCPSSLYCKDRPRKEVCSDKDKTYRSICYLKMDSCESGRKITVKHKGPCKHDIKTREERKRLREEKRQDRTERKKLKKEKKKKVIRGDPIKRKKKKDKERISTNDNTGVKRRPSVKDKQKNKIHIKEEIRKERRRHRRRLRKIKQMEREFY